MGINTIIDILSSEEGQEELISEIEECKKVIAKRASIFLKEAKENNIRYLPYIRDFFITLIVDNAYETSEKVC